MIELLKQVASSVDIQYIADIKQLEGYCNQLDSDAFIPFTAEDLSADLAKKMDRYNQVIDEVIELIHADKTIETSKKGLRAGPYWKGYTRSLFIGDLSITLNYDRDMWKDTSSIETPFWVAIRTKNWKQPLEICDSFKTIPETKKIYHWNMVYLALEPLTNATFSEVCEDLKRQILAYLELAK